jgi:hypothetical protein
MYPFLLVMVLLTSTGELQSNEQPVTECPTEEAMGKQMADLRDAGLIKGWKAWCIATRLPMDKDGNPIKGQGI